MKVSFLFWRFKIHFLLMLAFKLKCMVLNEIIYKQLFRIVIVNTLKFIKLSIIVDFKY